MAKISKNVLCPCGSGKKYRKCCFKKKPREQIIMVGSPEPLRGLHYDKDKMEFTGLTADGRLIKPFVTFSQTHYKGESGKEKVLSRIQGKVISAASDLMRYLASSFDLIIGVDTNTRTIAGENVSATSVIYSVIQNTSDPNIYRVEFSWHGAVLFRNCPTELSPEKYGWIAAMRELNKHPPNTSKRFSLVTDHDLDNHIPYNQRVAAIFRDFYLPSNFTLMYGRSDGSTENLLNYLVKECDKKATEMLNEIEATR